MKYIKKGEEPESLTAWKALANENWTPTYDDLRGREKTEEIQQLAVGYDRPDAVGQYTAFCGAIVYILKHYFVP